MADLDGMNFENKCSRETAKLIKDKATHGCDEQKVDRKYSNMEPQIQHENLEYAQPNSRTF
jgi:hypothetical protein